MAEPLYFELDGHTFVYGRCLTSPYVEDNLWFVFVPSRMEPSAIYFVAQDYATPKYFKDFWIYHEKWGEVAQRSLSGSDWNLEHEKPHSELPYYTYQLRSGEYIRYGLAKSKGVRLNAQRIEPDRELWYVVLQKHPDSEQSWDDFYIVHKDCTSPEFLEEMGTDSKKWMNICHAHPTGTEPWNSTIEILNPDIYKYVKGRADSG